MTDKTPTSTTEEKIDGISLDRFIDPDKFVVDVAIDGKDLNDAFMTQAGLAAYYGMLAARAAGQLASMKLLRDVTQAKVATEVRTRAAEANEKVTEVLVAERVQQDPRTKAVGKGYARAIEIEGEAKAAFEAFRQRKDMVVQLGAQSREEHKGSLRMSMTSGVSDRAAEIKSRLSKKV